MVGILKFGFKVALEMKDGLEKLAVFLCFVSATVVAPIFLASLAFFAIVRKLTDLYLSNLHGEQYAGLLDGSDAIWASEDPESRSVINILITLQVNEEESGESVMNELKKLMEQSLFSDLKAAGKLFYRRAQSRSGYLYWLKCEDPNVDTYIRLMDDTGESSLSSGQLQDKVGQHCNLPLPLNDTATWEVLVMSRALVAEETRAIALLIRVHHSVGDGVALLGFFLNKLVDSNVPDVGDSLLSLTADGQVNLEPANVPERETIPSRSQSATNTPYGSGRLDVHLGSVVSSEISIASEKKYKRRHKFRKSFTKMSKTMAEAVDNLRVKWKSKEQAKVEGKTIGPNTHEEVRVPHSAPKTESPQDMKNVTHDAQVKLVVPDTPKKITNPLRDESNRQQAQAVKELQQLPSPRTVIVINSTRKFATANEMLQTFGVILIVTAVFLKLGVSNIIKILLSARQNAELIYSVPFTLFCQLFRPTHDNVLHGKHFSGKKVSTWVTETNAEFLDKTRQLRRQLGKGTTFTQIMFACLSLSLQRFVQRKGFKLPRFVNVVVPARRSTSSKKTEGEGFALDNNFSIGSCRLPITANSAEELLKLLSHESRELRKSFAVNDWSLSCLTKFYPIWILHFFTSRSSCSIILSNLPGPKDSIFMLGKNIRELCFWVPNRGMTGVGISLLSYKEKCSLSLMADHAYISSKEEAREICNDIFASADYLLKETGQDTSLLPPDGQVS